MKELQKVFEFQKKPVRTRVDEVGDVWFVGKDVCDVLEIGKHRDAISRLDDDERGSVLVDTLGGPQETVAVNEPGLYSLILASRKPEAKVFKRWVFHEVLPAIRKTGKYELPREDKNKINLLTGRVEALSEALNLCSDQIACGFPEHKTDYLTEKEAAKLFGIDHNLFRSELAYGEYLEHQYFGRRPGMILRLSEKGKEVGEEVLKNRNAQQPYAFRWKRELLERFLTYWKEHGWWGLSKND